MQRIADRVASRKGCINRCVAGCRSALRLCHAVAVPRWLELASLVDDSLHRVRVRRRCNAVQYDIDDCGLADIRFGICLVKNKRCKQIILILGQSCLLPDRRCFLFGYLCGCFFRGSCFFLRHFRNSILRRSRDRCRLLFLFFLLSSFHRTLKRCLCIIEFLEFLLILERCLVACVSCFRRSVQCIRKYIFGDSSKLLVGRKIIVIGDSVSVLVRILLIIRFLRCLCRRSCFLSLRAEVVHLLVRGFRGCLSLLHCKRLIRISTAVRCISVCYGDVRRNNLSDGSVRCTGTRVNTRICRRRRNGCGIRRSRAAVSRCDDACGCRIHPCALRSGCFRVSRDLRGKFRRNG